MTMKTPEQWIEALDCVPDLMAEDVSAIQADARAEAESERDKAVKELTEVIGAIQLLQPAGSPPPTDHLGHVRWIVQEIDSGIEGMRLSIQSLREERDKALAANKLLVEALEFTLEASGDPDAARLPEAIERMEQALAAVKQP